MILRKLLEFSVAVVVVLYIFHHWHDFIMKTVFMFFFRDIYFKGMSALAFMYGFHVHALCPQRSEEGNGDLGPEIINVCEAPHAYW